MCVFQNFICRQLCLGFTSNVNSFAYSMCRPNEVKQIGNKQTFNLEDILAKNILASEYLKSLQEKSFQELVDEIYTRVKDTFPWLVSLHFYFNHSYHRTHAFLFIFVSQSGVPGRVPSTFFTIMFRMQMMHLTEDEV